MVRVDSAIPGSMASLLQPSSHCQGLPRSRYKTASRLPPGEPQLGPPASAAPNLKPTPSDMHANCIRTGMALT